MIFIEMMINAQRPISAFSLLEILTTVAVLGILMAGALVKIGFVERAAKYHKLNSDTRSINQAIRVYTANGGSIGNLTDPQQILNKLKTTRSAATADQYAGLVGSMVDLRLKAVTKSAASPGIWNKVVTWDASGLRFVVGEGNSGIVEFKLDDSLGATSYQAEDRAAPFVRYNTANGWVWPYDQNLDSPVRFASSTVRLSSTLVSSTGSTGSGSGTTSTTTTTTTGSETAWPPPVISSLLPPTLSVLGGEYRPSQFNLSVDITNPNPSLSSWVLVSVNQAPFATYTGSLSVAAGSTIQAYVSGQADLWSNSPQVSASYTASAPIALTAPQISPSSPQFTSSGSTSGTFDRTTLAGYGKETVTIDVSSASQTFILCPSGKVLLNARIVSSHPVTSFNTFVPTTYPEMPGGPSPYTLAFTVTPTRPPVPLSQTLTSTSRVGVCLKTKTGAVANGLRVEVEYASLPSGYTLTKSTQKNWNGAGGYGSCFAPTGHTATGGGFGMLLADRFASLSAYAAPGAVWPNRTFGPNEEGWIVAGPNDNIGGSGHIYVISFPRPAAAPSPVTVSISHSNPTAVSRLEYRIGATGTWTTYSAPFQVESSASSPSVTVESRVVSTSVDYTTSSSASSTILAAP